MKKSVQKKISLAFWVFIGIAAIAIFGSALKFNKHHLCIKVDIEIITNNNECFIDKEEVLDIINLKGDVTNKHLRNINLQVLENAIKQNKWVDDVAMFFDNNYNLQVTIYQRKPLMRIFCADDKTFYFDGNKNKLPVTDFAAARVLTVTNFPSSKDELSKPDSMLLNELTNLAKFIVADTLWNAQIAAININNNATFELFPNVGNQTIEIGKADNLEQKFKRIKLFYQQVFNNMDISEYGKINVAFNNQIVAVKKDNYSTLLTTDSATNFVKLP